MTGAGVETLLSDLVSCGSTPQTVHALEARRMRKTAGDTADAGLPSLRGVFHNAGFDSPVREPGGKAALWLQLPANKGHFAIKRNNRRTPHRDVAHRMRSWSGTRREQVQLLPSRPSGLIEPEIISHKDRIFKSLLTDIQQNSQPLCCQLPTA